MKKYIAPELEIVNFACEDIITVSSGGEVLAVDNSTETPGVAKFDLGSLDFTDNH